MIQYLQSNIDVEGYKPKLRYTPQTQPLFEENIGVQSNESPSLPDKEESKLQTLEELKQLSGGQSVSFTTSVLSKPLLPNPYEALNSTSNPAVPQQLNYEQLLEDYKTTLKKKEGCELTAYKDGDGWSIGYGHHAGVKKGDKITQEKAEDLLNKDIQSHAQWLISQAPKYNLTSGQFLALFDYAYNTGVGSLKSLMSNKDIPEIRELLAKRGLRDKNGQYLDSLRKRVDARLELFDS